VDADLIVAGFYKDQPVQLVAGGGTSLKVRVEITPGNAVIGSGAIAALNRLNYRKQNYMLGLAHSLLNLTEAKQFAEVEQSVFRHSCRKNLPLRAASSSRISVHASELCPRRQTRMAFGGFVVLSDRFDLIVIGCGPAGEKAGAQAAYFGKRVAIIERAEHVGGSCINTGTVPSKTLRESALYFSGLKQRGLYGIDYSLKENLTVHDFMHHEREVVEMERQRILKNLVLHHIELLRGQAAFLDPHTVAVAGAQGTRHLKGEVILISTGSKPHRPSEISFDDIHTFDSDTFLLMDRIPKSLAVIGGGVIGCEYASIFKALGVDVTLVDGRDRLLPFLDNEISDRLRDRLAALGMHFWFNERPVKTENSSTGVRLTMKSGKVLETDAALFAAGRRAAVGGLALEKAGLAINDGGYIPVDEHYRTAVPHIYAAGDVIGFPALASTSMEQGRVAACHAFGLKYKERVASLLPMGIYTIPEISAAGETEESCKEKKIDCVVGRALYENNARGHIAGDTAGLLKLIFARADKRLLGASIIGENATELIHIGMMVLDNGLTIDEFIEQVFNYPTLSELYKYAAYDGLGNLAGHKLREG
jgi:NAD(P) transhydrogenase